MQKEKRNIKETIPFDYDDFKISVFECEVGAFESAFHEAIEIKYYHKGGANVRVNANMYEIEEGDITVVNPYEIHSCIDAFSSNAREYKIFIDVGFLTEFTKGEIDLRKELITNGKRIKNHIKGDERLKNIILKIYAELYNKKANYRLAVSALVTEMFIIFLRKYLVKDVTFGESKNLKRLGVITPALDKIFKDYSQKITIEELADLCHLSKYHFCHAFKKEMDVTAVQYLINYRISVARAMLERSNDSVESIAYQCGFDDSSYFYRCYKKITGESPKKKVKGE